MRGRFLVLIASALGACGLTDGDKPVRRCAEPTREWWPLDPGNRWRYVNILFDPPEDAEKELVVDEAPAIVGGLAGDQVGIRLWRDEPRGTGWRWVVDEDDAFWFRRDVWLGGRLGDPPCEFGADDEVVQCAELAPTEDRYFLPGRKRLDYFAGRLCEGSTWEDTFAEWSIEIGTPDEANPLLCPVAVWREGTCVATMIEERTDSWRVTSVGRTIVVPAGEFDDTLCVRRVRPDATGVDYCFARGVGKVYEFDEEEQIECLAEYCVRGVCGGSPTGSCDPRAIPDE